MISGREFCANNSSGNPLGDGLLAAISTSGRTPPLYIAGSGVISGREFCANNSSGNPLGDGLLAAISTSGNKLAPPPMLDSASACPSTASGTIRFTATLSPSL